MEQYSEPIHCPACGTKFKVAVGEMTDLPMNEGEDTPIKVVSHKIPRKKKNGNGKKVVPLTNGNTRELITGLLRDLPKGSYLSAGAISKRVGKTINSTTSTLLQMTHKGELERLKEPNQPFAYRLKEKQAEA